MIPLGTFRGFFLKIFGLFLLVWIGMVVMPWMDLGHLDPLPVAGSDTDIVPWDSPGLAHHGEQVYIAAGCVYCHTQQVRPRTSGADLIRGWGTGEEHRRPMPRNRRSSAAPIRATTSGRRPCSSAPAAWART